MTPPPIRSCSGGPSGPFFQRPTNPLLPAVHRKTVPWAVCHKRFTPASANHKTVMDPPQRPSPTVIDPPQHRSPTVIDPPQRRSPNVIDPPQRHSQTVIPSEASRRIFFRVRSCERVGLRREESLFSSVRAQSALCVNVFSQFFPTTHYSLPTTHYSPVPRMKAPL